MGTFLFLIAVLLFCYAVTKTILANGKMRQRSNWVNERNQYLEHMEWLGVDYYTARESLRGIRKYSELVEKNKELDSIIKKRNKPNERLLKKYNSKR